MGKMAIRFFRGVSIRDGYVVFYLNDNENTELKLPFITEKEYSIELEVAGTLINKLPLDTSRTMTILRVSGPINENDITAILVRCISLEELDLSNATLESLPAVNFNVTGIINLSITRLYLPFITQADYESSGSKLVFSGLLGLQDVIANKNQVSFKFYRNEDPATLNSLLFPEGTSNCVLYCYLKHTTYLSLPSTLTKFAYLTNAYDRFSCEYCIINAVSPPTVTLPKPFTSWMEVSKKILVPKNSVDAYRASNWNQVAEIDAMEDYGY